MATPSYLWDQQIPDQHLSRIGMGEDRLKALKAQSTPERIELIDRSVCWTRVCEDVVGVWDRHSVRFDLPDSAHMLEDFDRDFRPLVDEMCSRYIAWREGILSGDPSLKGFELREEGHPLSEEIHIPDNGEGLPSVVRPNGWHKYLRYGRLHREERLGPALVSPNHCVWFREGLPSRRTGPAVLYVRQGIEWLINARKSVPLWGVGSVVCPEIPQTSDLFEGI